MSDQHTRVRFYYQRVQYVEYNPDTRTLDHKETTVPGRINMKRARTIIEQRPDQKPVLITSMTQCYDENTFRTQDILQNAETTTTTTTTVKE